MSPGTTRAALEAKYYWAAQEYLRRLPRKHFMEAIPQATQREITVECFALVKAVRPDFHYFNELLVQYPVPRRKRLGQVVPDNMVVLHDGPIKAEGSYDLPLQPAGPFMMLEYVSRSSERKDYDDNREKYEKQIKVPYYLLFYPEAQELSLFHHTGEKFVTVTPNEQGRLAIPELELGAAILDGWVRYWFRGELLPLPADLKRALDETRRERDEARRQLQASQDENARLRAELERRRAAE
jgi:Uma2 family endonuclease